MNYLLDTDICIYWLRGNAQIHEHFVAVGAQAITISVVTNNTAHFGRISHLKLVNWLRK